MKASSAPEIFWQPVHDLAENNCACATIDAIADAGGRIPSLDVDRWQKPDELYTIALPNNHHLLFNPFGPVGPVVLNSAAQALLEAYTTPGPLTTPITHQMATLGLLHPQGVQPRVPESNSSILTAWLHVTNRCNLRCSYCYIHKSDEAMSEATGKAALDAIFRSAQLHGFQTVKLKYAGGEATLNFALVQTLHKYAQLLAARTGLTVQEIVLSNGVALTSGILDFICATGMQLSISLDGAQREHDRQRLFANGRGSYRQVRRGVERALARGVRPHLSITVTGQSVEGLGDAVQFALTHDLLFNLNFYRDHDPHKSHAELRAEDERLIQAVQNAFTAIEANLPRRSLIAALIDRANFAGPHTRSCGAGHDYLVVDQNGQVARCQMEIERPVSTIFAADPLTAIRSQAPTFRNLSVEEKEGCRTCQWRYWCAGGCSLLTYRVTGRHDVKSPYCHVYQAVYPGLLRLEGLRLLKWASPAIQ